MNPQEADEHSVQQDDSNFPLSPKKEDLDSETLPVLNAEGTSEPHEPQPCTQALSNEIWQINHIAADLLLIAP